MRLEQRKKQLYKRMGISAILIAIVSLSFLAFLIRFYWIGPRCTTNFFHFNIDYRLGKEEVEDTIIREPYYKLLKMYEKHPSWKFTVECQAAMIEKIFEDNNYKEIKDLTEKLLEREQMELICGLQYSQLFYAYPADVLEMNFDYATETLNEYGLLSKRSKCLLFQEGQFGYGLTTILNSHGGNIDTVLVSTQQIVDFQPPGYLGANYPVYELKNTETDDSIYLLQYDYMPQWEAGYLHSWNFLLDAELAFEDNNWDEKGLTEFAVDQKKVDAYEQELLMLEMEGNQFFTCEEWVKHCIDYGAVGDLDYYIPECNWGTTKYNSSYIWAANNGDSTDDGELLANNYRCRNILIATRLVYDHYKASLSEVNRTIITNKFEYAEKKFLQATVTDATGIGPDPIERITAEKNVLEAQKNCSQILQILADNFDEINVMKIQVDLESGQFFNNTNNFLKQISITDNTLKLDDLPFEIDFSSRLANGKKLDPEYSVLLATFNSSNDDNEVYNVTRLDVVFKGTGDWSDDSILSIGIKFEFPDSNNNFREIIYSPSLLETETKRIWRYNYIYNPLYIFLPLSNGMIFIPDDYTGFKGTAIIKNVTSRHTSWLWQYYYIKVLETEGLHLDAHHQFYILENVHLDTAVAFANRINVNPTWVISKNVSLIQGNEVYDLYANMKNKQAEDQGSGEWW
ncbi:MAG: hypothetical protein ACTSR8_22245 [Promethearchaeota archaeon]